MSVWGWVFLGIVGVILISTLGWYMGTHPATKHSDKIIALIVGGFTLGCLLVLGMFLGLLGLAID